MSKAGTGFVVRGTGGPNDGRQTASVRFARGMQIAYIPNHAEGDIEHKDVEFGFITSVLGHVAFCRYWRKAPGQELCFLRTLANSEATSMINLVPWELKKQELIDALLVEIETHDEGITEAAVQSIRERF